MPDDPHGLTRRGFLAGGAGLLAAAACSKGGPSTTAAGRQIHVALGSGQLLSGVDQRVVAGVFRGTRPYEGRSVEFAFGSDPRRLGQAVAATLHDDGIPTRPYFLVHTRFDRPGTWYLGATVANQGDVTPLEVVDPATSKVPVPGQPMISTPTPTTADPKGVDPICTRQPPCPLHEVSLDQALGEHRPLGVLFATPALCESRTCGPVLEVLLTQQAAFADRVRMIHVEIYTNLSGQERAPAVQAYGLDFEPVLFLAGPDGVVRERLDGPFDKSEVSDALGRLASA